jgi:competence protein ComEC
VVFIALRLLALLLPKHFSQSPRVKSIAAGITLLLITLYLCVTGAPVSAVRAYVMIVLVLLAVLLRRQVDAMRSLSIAALLMLVVAPADLLDPGFQLSFAATLAIIAFVEARLRLSEQDRGRIGQAMHLLVTMLLISVVAELATSPIVISHFNNLSLYGVLANMLATPIMSLFLMPTVALFFLLLPLGLHHWALWLMKFGIEALLGLAHWVANLPHAQHFVPSIPGYGLVLFMAGLLWVCLWQSRVRRYGALAMVLGVATILFNHPPHLLFGSSLKQIAFYTEDGYRLARGRASAMMPELWANGLGEKQLVPADAPHWRCDSMGCIAQIKNKRIAFPTDSLALTEDCARAHVIITTLRDVKCATNARVIDAASLTNSNVTALWLDDEVRIETSANWQGNRPWSLAFHEWDDE